jgi:ribA/ribD-fused uncharacterized protein
LKYKIYSGLLIGLGSKTFNLGDAGSTPVRYGYSVHRRYELFIYGVIDEKGKVTCLSNRRMWVQIPFTPPDNYICFDMDKIDYFQGQYRFLSNFYYNNNGFNVECYYQSYKTLDLNEREKIRKMKPGDAKRYSYLIKVRPDWENIKVHIMENLVLYKFKTDDILKQKLLDTCNVELIEGNSWHDNFWGSCVCNKCGNKGKNILGKILMNVRNGLVA